jgi:heterodisulfide reductase subunit B
MEFALLRCCTTPIFLRQYESSTNAVLERLGIGLVDIKDFNCCGYPLRNRSFRGSLLACTKNLALAEKHNLGIMTVCNCCYGNLKHAEHAMRDNSPLRQEINKTLEGEGLRYEGNHQPKHLLQVLYHDIGIDRIRQKMTARFKDLRVATHYGCHILRPRDIVEFDNPFAPSLFDQLVEVTGAESVSWRAKLECCGSPMWGVNDELSLDLTQKKLVNAREAGADCLCVACSYCMLQFDRVQRILVSRRGSSWTLPSLLYTQLLGLCLGIDRDLLGLHLNEVPMSGIDRFLVKNDKTDAQYASPAIRQAGRTVR